MTDYQITKQKVWHRMPYCKDCGKTHSQYGEEHAIHCLKCGIVLHWCDCSHSDKHNWVCPECR